jgi:hypothetical protein
VQVYDWFSLYSPSLCGELLRLTGIPPRYVGRWRAAHQDRTPRTGVHGAVHFPRAHSGRHRITRTHRRPNDEAILIALRTVFGHLAEERLR